MVEIRAKPAVIGPAELANSFLGETIQVCVVTRDFRATMEGFVRLGIGPWRVLEFNSSNTERMTYRGKPADYSMKLCLAQSGSTSWEIVQPLKGPSIYWEFLDSHGEGVHHVAFGCNGIAYERRRQEFAARGLECIQSGVYMNQIPYDYYATDGDIHTTVEIYSVPDGFSQEPEEWFPARPPE